MWIKLLSNGNYVGCKACIGKKFNAKTIDPILASVSGKQLIRKGASPKASRQCQDYPFFKGEYEEVK